MLTIIILVTLIALTILLLGFFEIKIPVLSSYLISSRKKLNRRTRKILRKKIWHSQMHKGFIELPA